MGYVLYKDADGMPRSRECSCMSKRRSLRSLKMAGLEDLAEKCTFDRYECFTPKHENLLQKAKAFVEDDDARGMIITGQPGSGKTMLCVATTVELVKRGRECAYFLWRRDSSYLKSIIKEADQYRKELDRLRDVPVLYVDDLLKGGSTEADVALLFTIINDRIIRKNRKTLISTELSIQQLLQLDEASGSRVAELCAGYILNAPNHNYRIEKMN